MTTREIEQAHNEIDKFLGELEGSTKVPVNVLLVLERLLETQRELLLKIKNVESIMGVN